MNRESLAGRHVRTGLTLALGTLHATEHLTRTWLCGSSGTEDSMLQKPHHDHLLWKGGPWPFTPWLLHVFCLGCVLCFHLVAAAGLQGSFSYLKASISRSTFCASPCTRMWAWNFRRASSSSMPEKSISSTTQLWEGDTACISTSHRRGHQAGSFTTVPRLSPQGKYHGRGPETSLQLPRLYLKWAVISDK